MRWKANCNDEEILERDETGKEGRKPRVFSLKP
jgi:hypothetical protein